MTAILKRFSEPSSWAGIMGLVGSFGITLPPGAVQYITMGLAGICGLLAVFLPEKAS